jgi:hypothetical protein
MHQLKLPVFAPIWNSMAATDWGLEPTHDLNIVLSAPYKIATVPVLCSETFEFSYNSEAETLPWAKFDLVILSDIEFRQIGEIDAWANKVGIQRYVLAVGGTHTNEILNPTTTLWRPWWAYNLIKFNEYQDTNNGSTKPYQFDVLLGARRPHRDYVMLAMQSSGLINSSIVTYREVFTGGFIDQNSINAANLFSNVQLAFPYVSPNLNPEWEVCEKITNSISPFIPYKIYNQTDYTIICETLGTSTEFFLSEKTTKALLAKRVFVMFANFGFLRHLRSYGFKTFNSIIDESYDEELDNITRYKKAFEQVNWLATQDPADIYSRVLPILEHNQQQLYKLKATTKQRMQEILQTHIPQQYWLG